MIFKVMYISVIKNAALRPRVVIQRSSNLRCQNDCETSSLSLAAIFDTHTYTHRVTHSDRSHLLVRALPSWPLNSLPINKLGLLYKPLYKALPQETAQVAYLRL